MSAGLSALGCTGPGVVGRYRSEQMSDQFSDSDNLPVPATGRPGGATGGYGGLVKGGRRRTYSGAPPPSGEIKSVAPIPAAGGGGAALAELDVPQVKIVDEERAGVRDRIRAFVFNTPIIVVPPIVLAWLLYRVLYRGSCTSFSRFQVAGGGTFYTGCSGLWLWLAWLLPLALFGFLGWWVEVRPQSSGRASLGARRSKIQVVDGRTGGPVEVRAGFKRLIVRIFVSPLFFGVGYWLMLLDGERRTLHDRIAGTAVLNDNARAIQRRPPSPPPETEAS